MALSIRRFMLRGALSGNQNMGAQSLAVKVLITANSSWYIHNFFREVVGALIERKCVVTIVAPFDDRTMFLQDMGCDCVDLKMNPKGKNPFQEIVTSPFGLV